MKTALNAKGNYHCTICYYHSKHWNKTDKHMQIEHFKLKYGPCHINYMEQRIVEKAPEKQV